MNRQAFWRPLVNKGGARALAYGLLVLIALVPRDAVAAAVVHAADPTGAPESAQTEKAPQPEPMPVEPTVLPRRSTDLPWVKKKVAKDPLPVIRPPTGVRDILERYDLSDSQLEGFFNGQPLSVAEEEMIARILYRLPRIDLANIHNWRRTDLDLTQLVADPGSHRLEVIPLEGRLLAVEKREVTPELAVRLEMKHFYLARVNLTGKGFEALVALRRVPKIWEESAEELDEPVSLDGIFLKLGGGSIDEPQLVFLAPRLRWHPDHEIPEQHIGSDQLRLAELGLDLSLLETLRERNKKDIGDLDREPMYQLLDLVGKAPPAKLVARPRKEIDLVPLLAEPEKHQGELMSVEGFALRITRVAVDDKDIRTRFGIDHYFIIDLSVNLGDKTIKFVNDKTKERKANKGDGKDDSGTEDEEPIFNNDYPVTLCVRELPADLQPKDVMRDLIRADGIFMKSWSYPSTKFANKLQISPLLVAKTAHRVTPAQPYNWVSDTLVGFAIVAAMLIVGSVFWWFRKADSGTPDGLNDRAAPPSFAGLENVPTKPDFSALQDVPETPKSED